MSDHHLSKDIEDLHKDAVLQGSTTYVDPETGYLCFTELAHLQRGNCCGNQCRHCPFGWEHVPNNTRPATFRSHDKARIQEYLNEIQRQRTNRASALPGRRSFAADASIGGMAASKKTGGRHGGRLTEKNVPYTRTGDKGTSQLLTGERRSKDDLAFEAMGTIDELTSIIGVSHAELTKESDQAEELYGDLPEWLLDIMSRLFDIGSHVAKPRKVHDDDSEEEDMPFVADGIGGGFDEAHIEALEDCVDVLTDDLLELKSFILPTGSVPAAQLHNARCVCRRAERRMVPLVQQKVCDPNALKYVNRLSDFFFTAARWVNQRQGVEEIVYRRPQRSAKQREKMSLESGDRM